MRNTWQLLLGLAYVLTWSSITLLSIAMGTVRWFIYNVNREPLRHIVDGVLSHNLYTKEIYWTRYRGLFQTCYTDFDFPTYFPTTGKVSGDVICREEEGYDFNFELGDNISDNIKTEYDIRNHLLRTIAALLAFSLLANLIAFIVAFVGSCRRTISSSKYAALWAFLASLSNSAGMGIFHIVLWMESNKITLEEFEAGWSEMENHRYLPRVTTSEFGYSYMMGWVSAGVNFFSVLFYLFASFSLADYTRKIQEMTSLVDPAAKAQLADATYATTKGTLSPTGVMYGRGGMYTNHKTINRAKRKDEADEFFVADTNQNNAYTLAKNTLKGLVREDRPGEDGSEEGEEAPPARGYFDVEPESWYKEELAKQEQVKEQRKMEEQKKQERIKQQKEMAERRKAERVADTRMAPGLGDDRYQQRDGRDQRDLGRNQRNQNGLNQWDRRDQRDDRSMPTNWSSDLRANQVNHPLGFGHNPRGNNRFY